MKHIKVTKIRVNEDTAVVEAIRAALKDNDGYCPCRVEKTPETKCMCKEFLDENYMGECHCGLYVKEEI